jgi:branched-chain amino acid transport system ATP-binding protein
VANVLLNVKNLTAHYAKSRALYNVSLEVPEGSIASLIGANGAGKSTVLRIISGLKRPTSGEVWFDGVRIDRADTAKIVELGIVHVPEGRHLFPHLTVMQNLKLGATLRKTKVEEDEALSFVFELFPRLSERSRQKAGTLSGGEQQMLAIGRGLMAKPRLLMLDEPSLGLAPIVVEQLGETIRHVNQLGISVLLVEQNVDLALGLASLVYVVQVGEVVVSGDVAQIRDSPVVRSAYLGG